MGFGNVRAEETVDKSDSKNGNAMEEGQERNAGKGKPKNPREGQNPRSPGKGKTQEPLGRENPKKLGKNKKQILLTRGDQRDFFCLGVETALNYRL